MTKMTSAYANKLLKRLNEDKEYWMNKEQNSCTYTAAIDEEPLIPEYDYDEVSNTLNEIDEKITKIKHAINYVNVTVNTDNLVHTARCFSARFPVIECILSAT